MDIFKIEEMKGGWFAGNFEPTAFKTDKFEAAIHSYKMGEIKEAHFHKEATEVNYLLEGKFVLQNYDGNGSSKDPLFLEDCKIIVIKTPSVIGDKYIV